MRYSNEIKISSLICATLLLSACGASSRLSDIGKAPAMSRIENPAEDRRYKKVSMPMPAVEVVEKEQNSLWASNRQTFFKDQRANNVGDILTVVIDIDDEAELENETERSRSANESAGLGSFIGLEAKLAAALLPEDATTDDLIDADSTSRTRGSGSVEGEDEVSMRMAATVTQILPNGNMLIQGRQEVRVNFEKRILELAGVIRPEDITTDNTIESDKIAEARISYGGKGQISDVQQPRYGQQVYDVLFPF